MGNLLLMAGVFLASFIIGYLLISKVPSLLHTPLMSMTNAISAVTILGALILFSVPTTVPVKLLGSVAIITAAFNVVGGFAITDRMLRLFKDKRTPLSNK
ncbi:NAD(P) transhydrogenase subunit alpha [Desulfosarcina sp.]|uniref:NAD(P) transhydrogenase subunit alpha n=1 Tax=Desulfosarcina sp. TaxID=2027861 RepID=UPI00356A63EA